MSAKAPPAPSNRRIAELRAKPVLTPEEAFELLRVTESVGYRMIQAGEFPCKIINAGPRTRRVPTAALLRALGEED